MRFPRGKGDRKREREREKGVARGISRVARIYRKMDRVSENTPEH